MSSNSMFWSSSWLILAGLGRITPVKAVLTSTDAVAPFLTGTAADQQAAPVGAPAGAGAREASWRSEPTTTRMRDSRSARARGQHSSSSDASALAAVTSSRSVTLTIWLLRLI